MDAAEIMGRVSGKEAEIGFSALSERMEKDFDLFALKEYEADRGYESYTSSAPRNFFDKVRDALDRAQLSIQIKLPEDATETERKAASLGEEYLFGALAAIDRRFRARGEPTLKEQLGFFICLRGVSSLRLLVREENDETIFDVVVWDSLHVTYEWGANGLLWAANRRRLSKAQAEAEYPDVELEEEVKDIGLIDYWGVNDNAIVIGSDLGKPSTPHGIGHVPVYIGFVGSMPTVQNKGFESQVQHRGDSVWSAARGLYEPLNKYTSQTMDIYKQSVVGSMKYFSEDGRKTTEDDPHKVFQIFPLVKDKEDIVPLEVLRVPPETALLHSIIVGDLERSTLYEPWAYGGTKEAMSGEALKTLADATKSVYSPRTGALEQAYIWICEELLRQFAEHGTSEVKLKGYRPSKEGEGQQFFTVKVKPKDIDPEWYISVTCAPPMLRDIENEIMMAMAAKRPDASGRPMYPDDYIYENILKVQNPDAIIGKIKDQMIERMIEQHPSVMLRQMADALIKKKQPELAKEFLASMPAPAGGGQVQGMAPGLRGSPTGGVMPAGQGNVPAGAGMGGGVSAEMVLEQLSKMPPEEVARIVAEYQGSQGGGMPPG